MASPESNVPGQSQDKGQVGIINILDTVNPHKGVNLFSTQTVEILDALQKWETREDDVYIVTYPKSGTHWIQEIAYLITNGVDVEKIDRTHMLYGIDLVLAATLEELKTATPGYEAMRTWESPRVMGGHILEEFAPEHIKKKSKIIYFCRNPKDVAVSWFKFIGSVHPAHMGGWEGFLPYFLSEEMFGGSWFRHVKGWFAHKDDPNVLICKYEDFMKDLRGGVKRVADFLERPLSDNQLNKVVELTEMKGMQKSYQQIEDKMGDDGKNITRFCGQLSYLRKGKVGGWKDEFTVAQNEYFDKIYKEKMEGTGIEFEFEL